MHADLEAIERGAEHFRVDGLRFARRLRLSRGILRGAQQLGESLEAEWLLHRPEDAQSERTSQALHRVHERALARGGDDDGHVEAPRAQLPEELQAVHGGHLEIDDHQRRRGIERIE